MTGETAAILNVDDQEAGRYARRRMLERAGYRVIDANCGADAWRVLEEARPQLVLMDVNLPDISGFDLCRRIKNRPELADIMVLHVSASRVTGTDRAVGLEVGSDGYLIEPIDEKELLAAVRSLLRLRERQQENEGLLARLRRSEELFRGLFEQAAVGMCVVGSDGRLLRVNDKLCSITGRAEHDLMKQELRDLTHPEDRAEHESQVGTLLLGGISEVSLEQRLMRRDGDTIWVNVTLSIQWDAGGRIQSLIGVIEDIDARKRAELELRTHTTRQQLLSKTMDQLLRVDDPAEVMHDIYAALRTSVGLDSFLDYDVTPDNKGIRMVSWAGIPDQAVEPLMYLEFGQALCGTSAASRKPVIVGQLQTSTDPKAARMQATGSTAYACFPLIVGERLLGTLAFASSSRHSFDPDDLELLEAVSHYVAMAKERRRLLQETRQRAEQVAEQEERLRFATDGAGMGTWDVDLRTGRVVWNRQNALLLGYDSMATVASIRKWWTLVHEEDRPVVRHAMRIARDSGTFAQAEHRIRRADTGELRWLAPYGRIHYNEEGRPTRFVGVTFDMTERKHSEMQRQEWMKELERRVNERTKELVRTHDKLRGLAQDLTLTEQRERQRIAGELHDYLAQMLVVTRLKMNHASQMIAPHPACAVLQEADQLIDQSLTYTRTVVAELMPPTLRQFGLAAGLRWLGERMEQQGLVVHVDVPAMAPPLSEDHTTMLFQCVRELLFNVLKHSGTDRASVTMTDDGQGKLEIIVRDDGAGCDPVAIRESRGDKFGLFSIRERMEAIDGWMELESQPGAGTTVRLGLTVGRPDDGATTRGDQIVMTAQTGGAASAVPQQAMLERPVRVLLVDDHAMVRQGLRSILDGYPNLDIIAEAGDGEEAITLARLLKPDLIVMDVNMPRLDGIEATRRIREELPGTYVVGLSVNEAEHIVKSMQAAGASAFLTKESAADHLYETIGTVTRKINLECSMDASIH
ncbi:MAG TPA: response regulator [Nitrospira sp.]|jgi:PAS domain S-box-containing protein|nr:response regulator [Nitrospira sp.]